MVCASRPVVDQGWLPTTRGWWASQANRSSLSCTWRWVSVAPRSMLRPFPTASMIIAVNTDPDAPIFDVAQYGVEIDML